jgi:hypothetical protein
MLLWWSNTNKPIIAIRVPLTGVCDTFENEIRSDLSVILVDLEHDLVLYGFSGKISANQVVVSVDIGAIIKIISDVWHGKRS